MKMIVDLKLRHSKIIKNIKQKSNDKSFFLIFTL